MKKLFKSDKLLALKLFISWFKSIFTEYFLKNLYFEIQIYKYKFINLFYLSSNRFINTIDFIWKKSFVILSILNFLTNRNFTTTNPNKNSKLKLVTLSTLFSIKSHFLKFWILLRILTIHTLKTRLISMPFWSAFWSKVMTIAK